MIVVRQLCGSVRVERFWTRTIFIGVRLATALDWLRQCGWGVGRCGCGVAACNHAPLRLRLKGRCWIEKVGEEATRADRREGHLWPPSEEAIAALRVADEHDRQAVASASRRVTQRRRTTR